MLGFSTKKHPDLHISAAEPRNQHQEVQLRPDAEPPIRTSGWPAIVGGILRGGILRVLPPWLGSPINPRADKEEIERRLREKQEQEQAEREAKEELQRL
ncbi:MAG: hypothetical protein GX542_08315, partial [Rhodococcus sp.]|nr:hypothetical protein [Rhodococcus sp. (in: high G+C Gram-positive bacteria)]